VEGTVHADELVGDDGQNQINGGGGDDAIFGLGGADALDGASGEDELHGGDDGDVLMAIDRTIDSEIGGDDGLDICYADPGDPLYSCP
jgi:Ca2+-binding RTX toxin-like protein